MLHATNKNKLICNISFFFNISTLNCYKIYSICNKNIERKKIISTSVIKNTVTQTQF